MSLNLHVKKEKQSVNKDQIWINLEYCRNFFKSMRWQKGIRMRKSDSGSQTFGAITDSIVYLSWQPPFGTKFITVCKPISTMQDPKSFQEEFNKCHEEIAKYVRESMQKLASDPEKWNVQVPSGLGIGRFNRSKKQLDDIKQFDPTGYTKED